MSYNIVDLFLHGGWVMWPLLFFSVLTWAVVLERAYLFLTLKPRVNRLCQSLFQTLRTGDTAAARQLCHAEKAQIGEVFLPTLETKRSRESAERMTERQRLRLVAYMKKNLWILGTIGSASPFIGLLGTVVGIVRAFHSMAEKGSGGFSVVAGGISEALIATAAGLIVAIIAVLTYNIFVTAANQLASNLRLTLEELLDTTYDAKVPPSN